MRQKIISSDNITAMVNIQKVSLNSELFVV